MDINQRIEQLKAQLEAAEQLKKAHEDSLNDPERVLRDFSVHFIVKASGEIDFVVEDNNVSMTATPEIIDTPTAVEPREKVDKEYYQEEPSFERPGRTVSIDGKEYISVQEAARATKLHPYMVKDRCASASWPTWFLKD